MNDLVGFIVALVALRVCLPGPAEHESKPEHYTRYPNEPTHQKLCPLDGNEPHCLVHFSMAYSYSHLE
jgi:hypothetical protein